MIVKLDTQRLQTLDQIREFVAGSRPLDLQPETRAEAYAFVAETLQRFDYSRQGKADKGLIRRFLNKVTASTRAAHSPAAPAPDHRSHRRPPPPPAPLPTPLHQGRHRASLKSALHGVGPATRKLCVLLVRRPPLRAPRRHLQRTPLQPAPLDQLSTPPRDDARADPPVHIAIGERRRPQPFGQPGYLRVDSVHQGDLDGIKGLYHLNLVTRSPSVRAQRIHALPRPRKRSGRARVRSSPPGCKPSTSTSSPSPDPAAATTTPSSRARTARSSASTSDTATSPAVTLNASTPSPSRSSPPT